MERAVNACRQLDPSARPTALDICTLIEASAPRSSHSSEDASMRGALWAWHLPPCCLLWAALLKTLTVLHALLPCS